LAQLLVAGVAVAAVDVAIAGVAVAVQSELESN